MKTKMKLFAMGIITVLCVFLVSFSCPGETARAYGKSKRVLYISSYSYSSETVKEQITGIENSLTDDVILDYEFMDARRVNDETSEKLFYENFKYRYSHGDAYDLIVLGDDPALAFVLEHRDELFQDVPVLFCGVNDEELAREASSYPNISGLVENIPIQENIELGLQLLPDAKNVCIIVDGGMLSDKIRKVFYGLEDQYPELNFEEIDASTLSSSKFQGAIRRVTKDTILIYGYVSSDVNEKSYSEDELSELFADNSPVPAFCLVEGSVGDGLLGGCTISRRAAGEKIAYIADKIMSGVDPASVSLGPDSSHVYILDEQVVKKYNLKTDTLPMDITWVNRREGYFERNKEMMLPACIVLLAMLALVFYLVTDNMKRRKLMKELEETRTILESASQHDFLTRLPNRSKFMQDFEETLGAGIPCTIMMLDIDDFKHINDTYGHLAGDDALKELAARLKGIQSQILTPYRFAGDEFILILKSNQNRIVQNTAHDCRECFRKPFTIAGQSAKVSGSIGVASYPKDADNVEDLIICADDAMYEVKKHGKGNVAFYETKDAMVHEEDSKS